MTGLDTKISLIERDIDQIANLCDRIDTSIEKLTDVSVSLEKMIAVHEVKIEHIETSNMETKEYNKEMFDEIIERIADLESWKWKLSGISAVISVIIMTAITFGMRLIH